VGARLAVGDRADQPGDVVQQDQQVAEGSGIANS
jgi:hypothetical protein